MRQSEMEPGLLQVFRIYAWLRAFSLLFLPTLQFHPTLLNMPASSLLLPGILAVIDTAFLLAYLYWSGFRERMGRAYVPIALTFATLALMIEQHYFSPQRGFMQLEPLIYILLILTSWQYDFRAVIIFTVGTVMLQLGLNWFLPQPDLLALGLPNSPYILRAVTYGFLAARSVTFLVVGYAVTRLVKAQRKQRQELAQTNLRLIQHASTVEQLTISRERNRLSRELHDTLAHTLSALTVQLEALLTIWNPIPDKPRQMLKQMLATTRSGLDETRRALGALRATPIEEMGLALALRSLVEEFAERNSWRLEIDIPQQIDNLPAEVEHSFYRIAQEALENVVRHANAQVLRVKLKKKDQKLTLTIADDGKGFEPRVISEEQLGLRGMRERAELIGARLYVESQPSQGTTLTLEVELDR